MPLVNLQTSQGQPPDTQGVNGDMCWDFQNRFFWGPKGNITAGSWVGTANNANPQFASPVNNFANQGQSVGQYAYGQGIALSATPQTLFIPGTTSPATYTPVTGSALMGVYCYSNVAVNVALYDTVTNSQVYMFNVAAGKNFVAGPFSTTQYPLIAGRTYQWMVYGSASGAGISVQPIWLNPANSAGVCVSPTAVCGYSTNTTFSSTAANLPLFGTAAGANIGLYAPVRTGGIYAIVGTYTPSGSTTSANYVQVQPWYGSISSGAGIAAMSYVPQRLYATGQQQVIFGPMISDTSSLATGSFFYFQASGNGSGTLQVQFLALV